MRNRPMTGREQGQLWAEGISKAVVEENADDEEDEGSAEEGEGEGEGADFDDIENASVNDDASINDEGMMDCESDGFTEEGED